LPIPTLLLRHSKLLLRGKVSAPIHDRDGRLRIGTERQIQSTSLKLEHELWLALHHVAKDLNQSEKNILTALAEYKDKNISDHGDGTFTSLVRVFIVNSIIKKSNGSVDYTKQRDGNLNGLLSRVLSHSPT
jgi:predicted DNA-binding ribbon-helix-helix protein